MNISEPFIHRPVATTLLMIAMMLAGIVAYYQLPVSALPQVDYPTIQVSTFFPGASPDVMASSVTAPLERQFGQMPGLSRMVSSSSDGCSIITLQFSLDLNIDIAAQQVQAAINASGNFLPRDLPNPPIYNKINPADSPILTLALRSEALSLHRVQDLADTRLAPKLSQVLGVGLVSIVGGAKPSIRVQLNPTAVAAHGLNLDDVRLAITQANVNQAKGSFDGARQAYTISGNDQLLTTKQFRELIIGVRNGAPIYLIDVAEIAETVENERLAAWMNDQPAVIMNVHRQPGTNIIDVVDRVKKMLPQLQSSLPASVSIHILTDRTLTIRASVHDVQIELLMTIGLVILVIFIFLRTLSATIIPSIAVPLSLIGTLAVMYLLGYSLNNLTLMALTIATGFVVDDAIVMLENIARYIEAGEDPLQASIKGSREIGFTIISLSVSLIAVLIPLLFMGDIVGRLFREFAVTLSVAIMMSAIVSLTLTPMMSARLLKHVPIQSMGSFQQASEKIFEWTVNAYAVTLRFVLRHETATMITFLLTLAATVYLYAIVPKGFFPTQDTGVILGITDAPQESSLVAVSKRQQEIAAIILKDRDVESLSSFVGIDGTNTTITSGRLQINLKPLEHRSARVDEIIRRLQDSVSTTQGMVVYFQAVQDLSVDTKVGRNQYQWSLQSANPDELDVWVPRLVNKLSELKELRLVSTDQMNRGLGLRVEVDRDAASRLGINMQMIDDALYDAFGQRQVSTMFTQLNQYRVVMVVDKSFRDTPADLNFIHLKSPTGGIVPLSSIAKFIEFQTPLVLERHGQFPAANITFDLAEGKSLGEAVEAINKAKETLAIPDTIQTQFQGSAQAFQTSLEHEPILILAALVTVYIVLGVLYESFIHPITILSTLPSAGVGAILALLYFGMSLNVISLIGIILLIGIVKKNAIMMIDFALEAERQQGMSPAEAIYQASLLRFRPIMMTTLAALMGAVPLAFGTGSGSELRQPLGVTIIGGLLLSQLLTLYTTPVIYLVFDRIGKYWTVRSPESQGASHA